MRIGEPKDGEGTRIEDENRYLLAISSESIQRELDKILTSRVFAQSRRLSRFLHFIVEQAIRGRAAELKEYLIGVEVFDRKQSFDQRTDPIVRVEAVRLRAKLKEYYRSAGRDDEVRIECVKGSYVPIFRDRGSSLPSQRHKRSRARLSPKEPAIAVLPFSDLSPGQDQEYFCDGITEELVGVLTRVEGIRVASRRSTLAFKEIREDVREIGRKLNVTAILEGSVRKDGARLRISAQLTDVADGFELWSETHERGSENLFVIQDEIAKSIVENVKIKLLGHNAEPLGLRRLP